jgi:hypothetical protein
MEPEAICLKNLGLYDILDCFEFETIEIVTCNPLESHSKYKIVLYRADQWLAKKETIDPSLHVWNEEKLFLCLFGRPTASRLGIAGYIYKNFIDKSHLHFSAKPLDDNLEQFELDKLLHYHLPSVANAGLLIDRLPLCLAPPDRYTHCNGYDFNDPLTKLYQDILIDIVVESHVAGDTFYPTEKTARPMWLKKPFIVFASKDYLDYLHQLGFKTFCNYWSEEYDGYEKRDRYVRILELVASLASKSQSELKQMYLDMQPILEHNYNLLLTQSYDINNIHKII